MDYLLGQVRMFYTVLDVFCGMTHNVQLCPRGLSLVKKESFTHDKVKMLLL